VVFAIFIPLVGLTLYLYFTVLRKCRLELM
jgi:hypothetical protein